MAIDVSHLLGQAVVAQAVCLVPKPRGSRSKPDSTTLRRDSGAFSRRNSTSVVTRPKSSTKRSIAHGRQGALGLDPRNPDLPVEMLVARTGELAADRGSDSTGPSSATRGQAPNSPIFDPIAGTQWEGLLDDTGGDPGSNLRRWVAPSKPSGTLQVVLPRRTAPARARWAGFACARGASSAAAGQDQKVVYRAPG